jgi:hypothetical protein
MAKRSLDDEHTAKRQRVDSELEELYVQSISGEALEKFARRLADESDIDAMRALLKSNEELAALHPPESGARWAERKYRENFLQALLRAALWRCSAENFTDEQRVLSACVALLQRVSFLGVTRIAKDVQKFPRLLVQRLCEELELDAEETIETTRVDAIAGIAAASESKAEQSSSEDERAIEVALKLSESREKPQHAQFAQLTSKSALSPKSAQSKRSPALNRFPDAHKKIVSVLVAKPASPKPRKQVPQAHMPSNANTTHSTAE